MQDHVRHMLLFRTLVEAGSLTAAAEQLQLSKSVLSQHLKSLEQALGVQLLQRTTRRQTLTPAGQLFYQQCGDIQRQVDLAWQTARDSQQQLAGPLRITAPYALMDSVIAPVIAELVAQHPQTQPSLIADDQRLDLLEHHIDLAIRVGESPDSSLRQRKIGQFSDVLAASSAYMEQRPPLSGENCSEHEFIANAWQGSKSRLTLYRGEKQLLLDIHARRFANNLNGVLALARAGAGIAYIPEFVAASEPALQTLLPGFRSDAVNVYALHPYQPLPRLVRHAIEEIERHLQM